jgi:sporulation protein YlmC with PRC-barrel domain
MNSQGTFKVLREVRDLQVIDINGCNCGICDDIEFKGNAGGTLEVHSLLIGPGALRRRLPDWLARLLKRGFPGSVVRVPWKDVETITSRIRLNKPASVYGLLHIDQILGRYLSRVPSL